MKRKKRKRPGRNIGGAAIFVLLALVLPVSANMLRSNMNIIGMAGERMAAFAVMVNMPGAGLDVLIDRVRSEFGQNGQRQNYQGEIYFPGLPVLETPSPPEESVFQPVQEQAQGAARPLIRPRIPIQYQAVLLSENLAGVEGGQVFRHGAGLIRNDTNLSMEYIKQVLETPHGITFQNNGEPVVLIYHTHATEAFERHDSDVYDIRNTWRSNDNNINIVAVGAAMAQVLEENGIAVIHNSTQHDYPSHNRAYERSAQTIAYYLERYPSIRVLLDIHRDALERDNHVIVKPVAEINGQTAAQIMILVGCASPNLDIPHWRENLRFAAAFQDAMESSYPQLTRPVWLRHRRYNQHMHTGALLMEIGSNANTLEEAIYSATLAGQALADFVLQLTVDS